MSEGTVMDDPVTRDGLRSWLTQVRDGEMGADVRVLASVGLDFAGEVDGWKREHDAKLAVLWRTIDQRDAARAEREQLTAALNRLAAATAHLQFAIREGFEDHQWSEEFGGRLLDDAMLECDGALSVADDIRAALAATEPEAG